LKYKKGKLFFLLVRQSRFNQNSGTVQRCIGVCDSLKKKEVPETRLAVLSAVTLFDGELTNKRSADKHAELAEI
jgi:hypothetical protein